MSYRSTKKQKRKLILILIKAFTMSITEQIVMDKNGNAVAVQIPVNQYKKIKEMLEELEDIKAFNKAMNRKQQFSPFEEAVKRIKARRKNK
jgi:PHD/YefM family antitoxin component YafN of YafNO toxin-antitoxin module